MFLSTTNKITIKTHFIKEYLPEILFTRIYLVEKCQCALLKKTKKLFKYKIN